MIPSDVASRLQLTADAAVPRTPNTQQVSDALSNLVPGQRVLAEIQALLPNGAYRALINQRDVTLALPFSAKAGDSLELEVVENEGQMALALVSRRQAQGEAASGNERPAVETTLSRTASFIGSLLPRRDKGEEAPPALLNANQPIAQKPPTQGADLVPLLKQAITQSGMFYEAHQSRWVNNALPLQTLLSQPQGLLSNLRAPTGPDTPPATDKPQLLASQPADRQSTALPAAERTPAQSVAEQAPRVLSMPGQQAVAPDLLPLVQQQLEALATQTYVWHGQAWPGQPMQWEIVEENGGKQAGEEASAHWQTRLILTMPNLGEVKAALRFTGGKVSLSLSAATGDAAAQLTNGGDSLRKQLEAAGLSLAGFTVARHEPEAE